MTRLDLVRRFAPMLALALASWTLATTAVVRADASATPMFVSPHRLGRARVWVTVTQPDGTRVVPCGAVTSGQTCVGRGWFSEPGTYELQVSIGRRRLSSEVTFYGDEVELEVDVYPEHTRVDVGRRVPNGIALRPGRDWDVTRVGDEWAPYVLSNQSALEFNVGAFGSVLIGSTDRLEPNGRWARHHGVTCAFGSAVRTLGARSEHPAGGPGAATPGSQSRRRGHYRFVVRLPIGTRGSRDLPIYSSYVVAYEFDVP